MLQPHDPHGCVQETLSVDIKPGWKGGTRITFDGKGALRIACIAIATVRPAMEGMQQRSRMVSSASAPVLGMTGSKHCQA